MAAPFTMHDAMIACGVNNVILFNGETPAQRMAVDIFDDDFASCIDKTQLEFDDDLKGYSALTVANGQIRLPPATKKNIRAFMHWTSDKLRLGEDPSLIPYPVANAAMHLASYKTLKSYRARALTIAETAKPGPLTEKTKWEDWNPVFINFLRSIPGRHHIPLKYIIRDSDAPVVVPGASLLDDYINRAPLNGDAFETDASEVHTYLISFITGNRTAESKVLPHANDNNGRLDYLALKAHYEGVGVNAVEILKAEKVLADLFYSGERKPHMWWEEFERQLTRSFAICDRTEQREVYSENQKLRLLCKKVNADFLNPTRTSIQIELTKTPMTMTYVLALANFRNEVNRKYPPEMAGRTGRSRRSINAASSNSHGGRGGRGGRGRNGGRGGRGRGRGGHQGGKRSRVGARIVTGNDGNPIEVHPSYSFETNEWRNIPQDVRNQLVAERQAYKRQRQASALASYNGNQSIHPGFYGGSQSHPIGLLPPPPLPPRDISVVTGHYAPPPLPPPHNVHRGDDSLAQHSQGMVSIMGGRNEQASLRSRNTNNIRAVVSKPRNVSLVDSALSYKEAPAGTEANNESDTNADTCCLGANFAVLSMTHRSADVFPYDKSYKPIQNVPIVTGATAWDDPTSGETFILVFHEALYYGAKLPHSLINPNQIRHQGHGYWDNPYDKDRRLCIDVVDGPLVPLQHEGTKLLFTSRTPTAQELVDCIHIEMTSKYEWNPADITLGEVTARPAISLSVMISKATTTVPTNDFTYHGEIDDIPARRTFVSGERHAVITADALAERWCIGPKRAHATLQVTTQRGVRSAILPLSRRYKADRMYNMRRLQGKFATDTFYPEFKSLNQNKCAQIYSHKCGFAACYPMMAADGNTIGQSLMDFSHDFGVPEHLTFDGALAQTGKYTDFMKNIRRLNIDHHISGPRRPNENPAEASIRELKKRWYRIMMKKKVPRRLWDFGVVWVCETNNVSVSSSRYAKARTPLEIITGETPDISEHLDFSFYDWVTYRTNAGLGEPSIGRWLGVSHKVGQLMSYWILTDKAKVISCTTVQRLTHNEQQTDEYSTTMDAYNNAVNDILDVADADLEFNEDNHPRWNRLSLNEFDIEEEFVAEYNKVVSDNTVPEADDVYDCSKDNYLSMEIGLARGADDQLHTAVVKRRAVDIEGTPIGVPNDNPLLDSRRYEVEFSDGTLETISANVIAENLLAQVDDEGHRQLLLSEIIDHRQNDDSIPLDGSFYTTASGSKRRVRTTKGWDLCVQWKDGTTNWISLKDMKNSNPVDVAQYAKDNSIDHLPAFAWWVPYVMKKRDRIISRVKSKYWDRSHKFGIKVPKSAKEAYALDRANGNTLWADAIAEEMKKVRVAFDLYEDSVNKLVGYSKLTTHLIFDIKMSENFRRKARLVADGHKTDPPASVTYSTVVSRDSIRICLMLAALNDLDVKCADVENAYLNAPCREKYWTVAGPEFGNDEGKIFIICRALYGLKSSGAAYRSHLAKSLDEIGFKSSLADPDVWLRACVKSDGEEYYEYMLVYVDDLMCISHKALETMSELQRFTKFKKDKIEDPTMYLGATLEKKRLGDKDMWTMSSRDYIKAAIDTVEEQMEVFALKFPSRAVTPMIQGYAPELDASEELESKGVTFFQELIGILRWAIEIGRVDIYLEVSMISAFQASPRRGHLEQLIHVFAFLKKNPKLTLYFDPNEPSLDPNMFTGNEPHDFREFYRDAEEQLPNNMPKPRGRRVTMTAFVDASHAANKVTRRSHTGYIIFVNKAPIIWYSKRQNTVETSTFGSEFIAMKTCVEHIVGLRYKLRMFGVPIDEPTKVLCDNKACVDSSSKVESTLNKKHSSLAYHATRWAVAAGSVKIGKVDTKDNISDALTKTLTVMQRNYLFGNWTY